ncbi:MAG: hypothetical protein H6685_09690 [Deltaproteobacteria bacterium]|nr:hypothetical protein [Deltaproteobacteria bacterium]
MAMVLSAGSWACGGDDDDDDDAVADDDSVDDDDDRRSPRRMATQRQCRVNSSSAAAARSSLTTKTTETVWAIDRCATATDGLRALWGDEKIAIVAMDLVTLTLSWARKMRDDLAVRGFDPHKVFIAATHVHEAPDTVGVYGPSLFESGVSPEYMEFLRETVVDLVDSLDDRMTAVSMTAGSVDVNDPLSNTDRRFL